MYAERWRVGDPETHLYRGYDLFNSRETGFTDRHVELGEEYHYYIYPWVINDLDVPRYSRDDSELGFPAQLFRVMPPKPPFVPAPPPNFHAERYRFYAADLSWDRVDHDTPAFIVQWPKSDQEYQTTGSESENRTVINSQEDYTRRVWQDEGFYETRVGPAKKLLHVTGLVRNTTYYFRVGTCAVVSRTTDDIDSCVMADVHWAPERSVYTYWPY